MDSAELTVLPGPDTLQEAHHIGLLLAVQLLDVLVCTHDYLLQQQNKEEAFSNRLILTKFILRCHIMVNKRKCEPFYLFDPHNGLIQSIGPVSV